MNNKKKERRKEKTIMAEAEELNWDIINVIPHYTGALSIFGSTWIIIDILRRKRQGKPYSHRRILLILSIFDVLASFWFFMSAWAWPPNGGFGDYASTKIRTNKHVCEVSGFFIQLASVAIPIYNVALSMHLYLNIRYSWNEEKIYNSFERYIHVIVIPLALILAIIPWPLQLYNPWYFYCWVSVSGYLPESDETGVYERGTAMASDLFHLIYMILVLLSALVNTGIMMALYCRVRNITNRSRRYSISSHFQAHNNNSNTSAPINSQRRSSVTSIFNSMRRSSNMDSCTGSRRSGFGLMSMSMSRRGGSSRSFSNRNEKVRRVAIMALLYTIPFYLTWVIPVCFFLRDTLLMKGIIPTPISFKWLQFVPLVYIAIAQPLQGFCNWIVYMYPQVQEFIKKHPISCCCDCSNGMKTLLLPFRQVSSWWKSSRSSTTTKDTSSIIGCAAADDNDDDEEDPDRTNQSSMMTSARFGTDDIESNQEQQIKQELKQEKSCRFEDDVMVDKMDYVGAQVKNEESLDKESSSEQDHEDNKCDDVLVGAPSDSMEKVMGAEEQHEMPKQDNASADIISDDGNDTVIINIEAQQETEKDPPIWDLSSSDKIIKS